MPVPCRLRPAVAAVFVVVCLLSTRPDQSAACPVCAPLPQTTVADDLLAAAAVVFARQNPDAPFSYRATEILRGQLDSTDIDYFVDSVTRRRLAADPGRVAVLVLESESNVWRSLGVADREYQQVVRQVVLQAADWSGRDGRRARQAYFQTLFGSRNRAVFELAYLELGRAPYETIRRFGRRVSSDDLQPLLSRSEYLEWRSLAILLLAQNPDAEARALISTSFDDCQRLSMTKHLAAWATALLEVNGPPAVQKIERLYLQESGRSPAELQGVLTALAVHGARPDGPLRHQLDDLFRTAHQSHPVVVEQFLQNQLSAGQEQYRALLRELQIQTRLASDSTIEGGGESAPLSH